MIKLVYVRTDNAEKEPYNINIIEIKENNGYILENPIYYAFTVYETKRFVGKDKVELFNDIRIFVKDSGLKFESLNDTDKIENLEIRELALSLINDK
jgi:hypothetical protein